MTRVMLQLCTETLFKWFNTVLNEAISRVAAISLFGGSRNMNVLFPGLWPEWKSRKICDRVLRNCALMLQPLVLGYYSLPHSQPEPLLLSARKTSKLACPSFFSVCISSRHLIGLPVILSDPQSPPPYPVHHLFFYFSPSHFFTSYFPLIYSLLLAVFF